MSTIVMVFAILLMAVWLCFAVLSVIDSIRSLKNERKREARELEYHEKRMESLK